MDTLQERKKVRLYTGSYHAPILTGDGNLYQGRGRGIQVFQFDEEDGTLEVLESYPEVANASWLAFAPDGKTLYAVNELDDYMGTKGGALSALAVDGDGRLAMRNCLPVMGAAPCHVNCDRSGKHVFTANYSGGSMSSFGVNGDGSLKALELQVVHQMAEGDRPQGVNALRQEKPHVHSASVFNGHLWITDLGLDEISVYELDGAGRMVGNEGDCPPEACCKVALPPGSGPRSLAFHDGGYVYVSCELSNEVGILHWEGDRIKVEGFVPCTPGGETAGGKGQGTQGKAQKENFPGGILLSRDGKYLYTGNRGHDSVGVYKVGSSGFLEGIQWISSGGKNPRGLQLSPSGRWLAVANQDSDNLVIFRRDGETGILTECNRYEAQTVVSLEFFIP